MTAKSVLNLLMLLVPVLLAALPVAEAAPAGTISDEKDVKPYTLPDPLICADGTKVTDAATWLNKRKPELMRMFESEMYGKTPLGKPANLRFELREEKKDARGGKATRLRIGVLYEDGKADGRQFEMLVYFPNNAKGPVPVVVSLNFESNISTTEETDIPLPKHFVNISTPDKKRVTTATEACRGLQKDRWQYDYALDHGYAVATACYHEVEPDANGRWKEGPRGLLAEPAADQWGSIGAWAWAMSRMVDYLETDKRADPKKIVGLGHSRLGKTSVWAGVQDERFAVVVSNNSGAGGAALSKRIFGETTAVLNKNFPHWFCGNFKKYSDNEDALAFDQHELIALVAPRPMLILSATEDLWADPKGEFLSGVGADPVYRLLGTDGISQKEWPAPGGLLTSRIGYNLRVGKHDVTLESWQAIIQFSDKHFGR